MARYKGRGISNFYDVRNTVFAAIATANLHPNRVSPRVRIFYGVVFRFCAVNVINKPFIVSRGICATKTGCIFKINWISGTVLF